MNVPDKILSTEYLQKNCIRQHEIKLWAVQFVFSLELLSYDYGKDN